MFRTFVAWFAIVGLVSPATWAQIPGLKKSTSTGSEYFVGMDLGKPLVRVNLLSGVHKPGVYNVPVDTNLLQLVSYAGGATKEADLSDVSVRGQSKGKSISNKYDLEELVEGTSAVPSVRDSDVVMIPTPPDSLARTQVIVGILAGLASIALSVAIIDQQNRN